MASAAAVKYVDTEILHAQLRYVRSRKDLQSIQIEIPAQIDFPPVLPLVRRRVKNQIVRGSGAVAVVGSGSQKRPAEFPGRVSADMPEFFPWWEKRKFS